MARCINWLRLGQATLGFANLIRDDDFSTGRVGLLITTIGFSVFIEWLGLTLTTFLFLSLSMIILSRGKRPGLITLISAAMALGGWAVAKAGKGQQALAITFVSSTIGGLLTTIIALATMPILARVGFYMHSIEMIVVMLFGISLIASIAAQDMIKGLFAVSEAFIIIEKKVIVSQDADVSSGNWHDTFEGVRIALSRWWHIIWTSIIGLIIGVIPGAGASIASFVAYQQSRSFSKTPELYGTGHPEGLIAPESANNGVTSGTLVPLLVLGIPGGATAAIMLVVMQFHGVSFGPSLFADDPKIGYGMFMAMAVSYHDHQCRTGPAAFPAQRRQDFRASG